MFNETKVKSLHFLFLLFVSIGMSLLFGNPRVSYDGWQYISSALALGDGTMAENFFWVRQPGYPLLLHMCFYFGYSLWTLVLLQTSLFTISFFFMIWQARKYFLEFSTRKFLFVTTNSYLFIFLFLGGYNLVVLPQSITSSFLMVLVGVLIKFHGYSSRIPLSSGSKITSLLILPLLTLIGFSISPILSYLTLILNFFIACVFFIKSSSMKMLPNSKDWQFPSYSFITSFFLSIFMFVCSYFAWKNLVHDFSSSPNFNVDIIRDPFWDTGFTNYLKNLKSDPQILHFVPASFMALLMLIPNTGWNGLVIEKPLSFHSQNADIGFGLFSNNYSSCISIPDTVLGVNSGYVEVIVSQKNCALTDLNLPQFIFFPLMLIWLMICIYWLSKITFFRKPITLLLSIVPLIYLSVYAILGGGIDRYGSSVYPIIILFSILEFVSSCTMHRKLSKR